MSPQATTLATGVLLGIAFSPMASAFGAGISAGVARAVKDRMWANVASGLLVFLAWLIGDGYRVFENARGFSGLEVGWTVWAGTALWGLLSLGVGYVLPYWYGRYVGSHVSKGSGWLSAACMAALAALVLSRLVGTV